MRMSFRGTCRVDRRAKDVASRALDAFLVALLVGIVLVTGVDAGSSKPPICAKCGKPIAGDGAEIEGQAFHSRCFVCAACGKPIEGPAQKQDGRYAHPACWEERYAPRCGVCGKPIVGEHRVYEGVRYHEACYAEQKAPICLVCGKRILGTVLTNIWSETIHAEHEATVQLCSSCGRYALPEKSSVLPDGRVQCDACRREAVRSKDQARDLVRGVAEILAASGIELETKLRWIRVKLVDRNRLRELQADGKDKEGVYMVVTETDDAGMGRTYEWNTIFLLSELPVDKMKGVAAHELFHLWQHEHGADAGDARWSEGSAQVASEIVYRSLGSDLALHLLDAMQKEEDPIYGGGYREAREYFETRGIRPFLVEVVRRGSQKSP